MWVDFVTLALAQTPFRVNGETLASEFVVSALFVRELSDHVFSVKLVEDTSVKDSD